MKQGPMKQSREALILALLIVAFGLVLYGIARFLLNVPPASDDEGPDILAALLYYAGVGLAGLGVVGAVIAAVVALAERRRAKRRRVGDGRASDGASGCFRHAGHRQ